MNYNNIKKDNKSLMAKYLSRDIFEQLKDKKTSTLYTLEQAINSGIKNPDSSIGMYAGDEESYELFKDLFNPIINEYHNFTVDNNHTSNLNSNDLNAPIIDIENKYILSTRIRVGRNLKNIPLGPAISNLQREQVEKVIASSLNNLSGDLKGSYYKLDNLTVEDREKLIQNHFLFKEGDRFLQAAGLNNNWPKNRGIFHNDKKTFLVWVNEEDQLRIISMQQGGNIKQVFKRLTKALAFIEKEIQFAYNNHLGYITSCPTNLGTAMRASVHIKLPKLSSSMTNFKYITDKYSLQIRGTDGEHSSNKSGIFDISNKRRLGITEVQCVQSMYDGVVALIKAEEAL